MIQIDEISHLLGQFTPLCRELHDVLTALMVIVLHRDVLIRFLVVDIFFSDAQFLLHTELHRQSVCIPSGFTLHLKALHGLVAVKGILDAACQHMVDTGMTIGRWRTLEEDKLRAALSLINTLVEDVVLLPFLQHLVVDLRQIETGMFGKSLRHK